MLNWNFQRTGVLKYENIRHSKVLLSNLETRRNYSGTI
jgi:hypothetical protein